MLAGTGYSRSPDFSIKSAFEAASRPGRSGMDLFSMGMNAAPGPQDKIELTDIMPNTKFHLPVINPVSKLDSNLKVTEAPQDPTVLAQQVDATAQAYLSANEQAMATIEKTMAEVDPVRGPAVAAAIRPAGGNNSATQAATSLVDPTGMAGDLYSVLSTIRASAKGPDNAEINEVLEKTLTALHKQSEQQHHAFQSGQKSEPPKFDFRAIKTPEQLKEFIQRDPMQDKVMQKVQEAHLALDVMRDNKDRYENHYGDKITLDKIEAAPKDSAGETLIGDMKVEAKLPELEQGQVRFTATEAVYQISTLGDVSGLKVKPDALKPLNQSDVKDALAKLHQEPDPALLRQMNPSTSLSLAI